jgi:hypothetical protein
MPDDSMPAVSMRRRRVRRDDSPLGIARAAFGLLTDGPGALRLDGRAYPGLPDRALPLAEARALLLAPSCSRATRDAVWAELVHRSRTTGAAWTVAAVGMALPALSRMAADLCAAFAGDKADIQAELLRGFLTGLAMIDLEKPSVINRLRWHAYRAGHAAIREALDAPTPFGAGFESTPPLPVAGHPDFVLARAVTDGAITQADAEVIGTTRLEDVSLREWADTHGLSYANARQVRSRAERRLLAWLTQEQTGTSDTDTRAADTCAVGRDRSGGVVSHIRPGIGVGGCRRTLRTPPAVHCRPAPSAEEPRCA